MFLIYFLKPFLYSANISTNCDLNDPDLTKEVKVPAPKASQIADEDYTEYVFSAEPVSVNEEKKSGKKNKKSDKENNKDTEKRPKKGTFMVRTLDRVKKGCKRQISRIISTSPSNSNDQIIEGTEVIEENDFQGTEDNDDDHVYLIPGETQGIDETQGINEYVVGDLDLQDVSNSINNDYYNLRNMEDDTIHKSNESNCSFLSDRDFDLNEEVFVPGFEDITRREKEKRARKSKEKEDSSYIHPPSMPKSSERRNKKNVPKQDSEKSGNIKDKQSENIKDKQSIDSKIIETNDINSNTSTNSNKKTGEKRKKNTKTENSESLSSNDSEENKSNNSEENKTNDSEENKNTHKEEEIEDKLKDLSELIKDLENVTSQTEENDVNHTKLIIFGVVLFLCTSVFLLSCLYFMKFMKKD